MRAYRSAPAAASLALQPPDSLGSRRSSGATRWSLLHTRMCACARGISAHANDLVHKHVWTHVGLLQVQSDVFGLSNFLAAAILLSTIYTFHTRYFHAAMLTALICGLALTNQHTSIFLVLPVAVAVLAVGYDTTPARQLGRWAGAMRRSLMLFLCGTVGLTPYLYLPLAARNGALVSWGDCASLKGFIRHLSRAEYGAQLW